MKHSKTYLIAGTFALIVLMMNSCKEVGPVLPWGGSHVLSDTTYTEAPPAPQLKNVLIELFTGITCVNCPPADSLLSQLANANPGPGKQVIGIAMHSAFQDDSIPRATTQSMTSPKADALLGYYGPLNFKPSGAVDRIYHASASGVLDDPGNWSGDITAELSNSQSQVNLSFAAKTFDPVSKVLTLAIKTEYVASQTDSDKLSIFLTEDSIVTAQYYPVYTDTFFVHNHVFRDAVTNILGDPVNANSAGSVNIKTYSYTITNPLWRPAHMHIVAFIHENKAALQPPVLNVLQVQTISLQ